MTHTRRRALVTAAAALILATVTPAAGDSHGRLAVEHLDRWLARAPHVATRLGDHARDARLEPVTEATVARDRAWYRSLRDRLAEAPARRRAPEHELERRWLAARAERALVELELLQPHARDPAYYIPLIAGAIHTLLDGVHGSPCLRVRNAARRLARVPEVLRAARINLRHPARELTAIALDRYAEVLRYYREEVRTLSDVCREPSVQAELAEADSLAAAAVEDFIAYLDRDVLPAAAADVRLGRAALERLVAAAVLDSASLDSLAARGRAEVEGLRGAMAKVAARIAPGAGVAAALESLAVGNVAADALPASWRAASGAVQGFLAGQNIAAPIERLPVAMRPAPGFELEPEALRLVPPGPWERRLTGAVVRVRLPAAGEATASDPHSLAVAAMRELAPGRLQWALAVRQMRSRLSQALAATEDDAGWTLYCEGMVLGEGFGAGDPRPHLAQLALALRRAVRLVATIGLHTGALESSAARRLFVDDGLLSETAAESELRLCLARPDVILAVVGRWQFEALRDEVEREQGASFRLRSFHDAVLRHGAAPAPLLRPVLLPGAGAERRRGR